MGSISVPADRYWGAQTERSLLHFSIGDDRMPKRVYHAYGYVKKAAALTIGGEPVGALVEGRDGNFYGVTTAGYGAVFQMTPSGSTKVLYSFNAYYHAGDAAGFQAGLVMDAAGDFYGDDGL